MDFLNEIATPKPVPAGGAAAAYVANLGMALVYKVLLIEVNRKDRDPGAEPGLLSAQKEQERLVFDLKKTLQEDPRCYVQFSSCLKAGDRAETKAAFLDIMTCSMEVIEKALQGLDWVMQLSKMSSPQLSPHLRVAAELLASSIAATGHVVRENLKDIQALDKKKGYLENLEAVLTNALNKKKEALDNLDSIELIEV